MNEENEALTLPSAEVTEQAETATAPPAQQAAPGEEAEVAAEATAAEDTVAETVVPPPTSLPEPVPEPKRPGLSPALIVALVAILVAAAAAVVVGVLKRRRSGPPDSPEQGMAKTEAMLPGEEPKGVRWVEPGRRSPAGNAAPVVPEQPQEGGVEGYSFGYAQTVGARENQEDSYCISRLDAETFHSRGLLAAVADGIGGLNNGQVASGTVMYNMAMRFEQQDYRRSAADRLLELAAAGQEDVLRVNRGGDHCGTTLVSALITQEGAVLLSVGDSRIALCRAGVLLQLNREHTLGRERDEAEALGQPVQAENRRRDAITSYLGKENLRQLDRTLRPMRLVPGDRLLLMSDGVFNALSDEELLQCLQQPPQDAARAIIAQVDEKKIPHQDNATIVIVGLD